MARWVAIARRERLPPADTALSRMWTDLPDAPFGRQEAIDRVERGIGLTALRYDETHITLVYQDRQDPERR